MFHAAKDALTSRAAQTWVNKFIAPYGKLQDLTIDTRRKTLEATCMLDGEVGPITVRVGHYEIEAEGDKKYIRASDFTCTRPWLQKALADHATQHRLELPPWAAAAL